ncbi:RNA polymerase factor sigma-54 [Robbsia sp. Bb-Pol-6]|uniref:RNA polymerase sigma-54 factor n=2 Tax=Robbsia betulipollinis TaxID=2981849 RepID=A0ABT3ZM52_9BURK|nr:RNA polymerase factor sigma-54 [Robbsia betulipollinis]
MTHPSIELRARQSLTLTPRMQQSVRLLQLSALEFTQEVNNALATNPFLEAEENAQSGNGEAPAQGTNLAASGQADPREMSLDGGSGEREPSSDNSAETSRDNDVEGVGNTDNLNSEGGEYASDSYSSDSYSSRSGTGDGDGFEAGDWMHVVPNLREKLHQSLRLSPLMGRDRLAAQIVIESLEDDGYLRQSLDELVELGDCDPPLSTDEFANAVRLVQTLDQPGIAARSLAECLTLQLEALPEETPHRLLAIELVNNYLEKLAKREHAELQKRLGCDAEAVRAIAALIRTLDPKPGESAAVQENNYVIPDVIVRQVKGRWAVAINPAVMPRARVHRMYAEMFAQSEGSSRSPLAQQLQEARWLLRNVQQRFSTIQRVAETIVAHQRAFFDYGEIALKPLVLRDVADELDLHESTVSRATGNKYMATPRGIFEFKHFFPRELGTESGGTCSAAAVRALLKEMISAEPGNAPLSDVTLAKLLAQQGVIVARRTVAKYRRLMKVPPAEMRRA